MYEFPPMSDLIPQEITADILLRLRAKDLVNCRRVSKQWHSIIDDPHFIRSQLDRSLSANSSNYALFIQDRVSGKVVYWKQQRQHNVRRSLYAPATCYEPSTRVLLMGSCHGLVCFSLVNWTRDDFVIMNPSTGERHTLNNPAIKEGRVDGIVKACGFGYDELSDDYKVVRILRARSDDSCIAEIYGVRSKGFFRTIPLPSAADCWYHVPKSIGVFLGSSLHWSTWGILSGFAIHAIDLMCNTYYQLQLSKTRFRGISRHLSVGVVDRRLCVCGYLNDEREIGIWVMEEYWNPESWNRIYSLPYRNDYHPMHSLTYVGSTDNGEKILSIINAEILAWYDPTKKNVVKSVFFTEDEKDLHTLDEAIYCPESLVKIFPNVHYTS